MDGLRGTAAVAVMLFHFHGQSFDALKGVLRWGWLGVDVFFVISGFVIPLSLVNASYTIRALPRFLARRAVRLDPPYFCAVVFGVAATYAAASAPSFAGSPPSFTMEDAFLHAFYLSEFAGRPWSIGVFWTLALELQFYLLMAVVFPFVFHARAMPRVVSAVLLLAASILPAYSGVERIHVPTILPFLPLFLLGIIALWKRLGLIDWPSFAALLSLAALADAITAGPASTVAATIGAVLLASVDGSFRLWKPLAAAAAISYPLYLVHQPFIKIYHILDRIPIPWLSPFGIIPAVLLSIALATVLHFLVEKPTHRLARRISLRPTTPTQKIAPAAPTEGRQVPEPAPGGYTPVWAWRRG